MPQLDVINYDNLIAGDVDIVTEPITIDVSQTVLRGDILKKVSGKFQRPSAAIVAADIVVVASESITTDASTTISSIGYKTGQFNSNVMRFGGTSTADDNNDVLAEKSIYIVKANKQ
ncbi:hypothetical protein [Clostridium sp.]|uniref:hypothetical protein n=1 Tax=Clostridium sp. TaxID=1506 RepID=UPI002627E965|nr:hypothetical protein [Clostridium sp.]